MLLLMSAAHQTHVAHRHPQLGRLVHPPDQYARIAETAAAGIPWAADNFAFAGFDANAYTRMLAAIVGLPGCRFVVIPDTVGDAGATRMRYRRWYDTVKATGQPVAYAAQDGVTASGIPWDQIDALFIGGTDQFKLGPGVAKLVEWAHGYDKWVHMGRVNSARRARYAATLGCDSFDGTAFSKWRDRYLQDGVAWAASHQQLRMGF